MPTELVKIDEVKNIFSSFPETMGGNTLSIKRYNKTEQALLDTIKGEGMNKTIDQAAIGFLEKVNTTFKNMGECRKPIIQIFDKVRSLFTSQEKEVGPKDSSTIPGKLVAKRSGCAEFRYEEEQRRRKEAEQRVLIDSEKVSYRQAMESGLLSYFSSYLSSKVAELQNVFSELTYVNFDKEVIGITVFQADCPKAHFDKFTAEYATYYINEKIRAEICRSTLLGKYEQYAQQCKAKTSSVKQDLIDRTPSKRKELAGLEQLRLTNAEEAIKAEGLRKQRETGEATE